MLTALSNTGTCLCRREAYARGRLLVEVPEGLPGSVRLRSEKPRPTGISHGNSTMVSGLRIQFTTRKIFRLDIGKRTRTEMGYLYEYDRSFLIVPPAHEKLCKNKIIWTIALPLSSKSGTNPDRLNRYGFSGTGQWCRFTELRWRGIYYYIYSTLF